MAKYEGFEPIIRVLELGRFQPPGDLKAALETLPPVDSLPLPWVTWSALGLLRYREQKHRAGEFLASILGTGWDWQCGFPPLDGLPSEELAWDQAEWAPRTIGRDLCLEHVETKGLIHVDLVYGPEVIQKRWFRFYLGAGQETGAAEGRYVELSPTGSEFDRAMRALAASGLIEPVDEDNFE